MLQQLLCFATLILRAMEAEQLRVHHLPLCEGDKYVDV
jgi:hypothetical protein